MTAEVPIVDVTKYGDIGQAAVLQTADISVSPNDTVTIYTPSASKIFVVYAIHILEFASDNLPHDYEFLSGSTVIGREVGFPLVGDKRYTHPAEDEPGGVPIMLGLAEGEAFKINVVPPFSRLTLKGWAQMGEVTL